MCFLTRFRLHTPVCLKTNFLACFVRNSVVQFSRIDACPPPLGGDSFVSIPRFFPFVKGFFQVFSVFFKLFSSHPKLPQKSVLHAQRLSYYTTHSPICQGVFRKKSGFTALLAVCTRREGIFPPRRGHIDSNTLGKRQIGELEISELVSTLLLSELAAIPISDSSLPMAFSLIPIFLIAVTEFIISDVKNRTPALKQFFDGRPNVLIRKGKVMEQEFRNARISAEEFLAACRLQGVGDPGELYYAVLEQNGQLSLLLKKESSPVTASLLSLPVTENGMVHAVITDGALNEAELSLCGKDKKWLDIILSAYGHKQEDVFLLLVDDAGGIRFTPKQKKGAKK